jgi:hypothetical protein
MRQEWAEADVLALQELYLSCSSLQIAKYLGRSKSSVDNKIHALLLSGTLGEKTKTGRSSTNPFWIRYEHTILLAKTCTKCGMFWGPEHYNVSIKKGKKYWFAECKLAKTNALL